MGTYSGTSIDSYIFGVHLVSETKFSGLQWFPGLRGYSVGGGDVEGCGRRAGARAFSSDAGAGGGPAHPLAKSVASSVPI